MVQKRNLLIDGWRGLSVGLVIFGHLLFFRFDDYIETSALSLLLANPATDWLPIVKFLVLRLLRPLQLVGVQVFFVISGYLITSLLLEENRRHGSVSIAAFYVRRVCRILPAFYVVVLATVILGALGKIVVPIGDVVRSALFLCNVAATDCSWWLAHTWSLAVEEQFYLVWPLVFVLAGRWRTSAIAALAMGLPVATLFNPVFEGFSFIAIGALAASVPNVRATFERLATAPVIVSAILILLLMSPIPSLVSIYRAAGCLKPLLVAIVFFGTIAGKGPLVPIVSSRLMQRIGLVSYSLYLWQQLSLAPLTWANNSTGAEALYGGNPLWILAFIVPALISYRLIESPMIALGHRQSARISMART